MNETAQPSSQLSVAFPFVSVLTIIGLTSLATNALIVIIICKYWKRRKGYELFILQAVVIDLVTTAVAIPFWIVTAIRPERFLNNGIACHLNACVCLIDILGPVMFLMLSCAYRHTALVGHPAHKRVFTNGRSVTWVLLAWVLSLLLCLPQTFGWKPAPQVMCVPDFVTNIWGTMYMLVFFYFLPLAASIFAHIFDIVLFQPEKMSPKSGPLYEFCTKRALRGKELDIQKSMLTVNAVHGCCWLPYILVSIAANLTGSYGFNIMGVSLHFITLIFGLAGTSIKGTLFCFENPWFKQNVKELCGCGNRSDNDETDGGRVA